MTSAQPDADSILGPSDVAAMFGVSTGQVGRWARTGRIPSFRTPGGHLRFRLSQVEPFLHTSGATEQQPVSA